VRDQPVAGVERESKTADASAGEKIPRRERPLGLGRGEVAHPPRVDFVSDPWVSGVERRRELSRFVGPERPRFLDLSVRVDAIEIEASHRDDLRGRGVGVFQDLSGLRGLSEEVTPSFAGGEPVGEDPLTRSRLPGENGRHDRHENQDNFSPERQHPQLV
jgi:hypothetical protein